MSSDQNIRMDFSVERDEVGMSSVAMAGDNSRIKIVPIMSTLALALVEIHISRGTAFVSLS